MNDIINVDNQLTETLKKNNFEKKQDLTDKFSIFERQNQYVIITYTSDVKEVNEITNHYTTNVSGGNNNINSSKGVIAHDVHGSINTGKQTNSNNSKKVTKPKSEKIDKLSIEMKAGFAEIKNAIEDLSKKMSDLIILLNNNLNKLQQN